MHSKKQRPLVRVMGREASVITHARDLGSVQIQLMWFECLILFFPSAEMRG